MTTNLQEEKQKTNVSLNEQQLTAAAINKGAGTLKSRKMFKTLKRLRRNKNSLNCIARNTHNRSQKRNEPVSFDCTKDCANSFKCKVSPG